MSVLSDSRKKSLSHSKHQLKSKVYKSLSDAITNANLNKSEYSRICSYLKLDLPEDVPKANYGAIVADAVHEKYDNILEKTIKTHPTMAYVLFFFLFAIHFSIFRGSVSHSYSWWFGYYQKQVSGGAGATNENPNPQQDNGNFFSNFLSLKGFLALVSMSVMLHFFSKLRSVLYKKNLQNELLKVMNNINRPKTPISDPIKDLQDIKEMMRHRRRQHSPQTSPSIRKTTTRRRRSLQVSAATATRTRRHR